MKLKFKLLILLSFYSLVFIKVSKAQTVHPYPFSTDSTHLTVWNGTEYLPFFVKGVNLGVAVPGTFPGELAATEEDYSTWFTGIKDAGFNCIRIYTLHYPRFYQVLDSFNLANKQNPLFFFQGVWLNEELPDYNHDLFFMADTFKVEIEENIDCLHGNRTILERRGKASGVYDADVSDWCMGYIIGREVYPVEIFTTNDLHPELNQFEGNHFKINNSTPSEAWFTEMLDHVLHYEDENYQTQRPVSASSWPTLDPIDHPEEINNDEDTAFINLSKVEIVDAPAGLFISYHAYPYYPDFVSLQSNYQEFYDDYGPNSYLGYLEELKSHYRQYPLIIAEYGVPSSWVIAHYATSGMNHGGFDEFNQGVTDIRILKSIEESNLGGGIQFAWIDEWFKRTWVTDQIDSDPYSRIIWSNISAAEQNYGLISYNQTLLNDTIAKFESTESITYMQTEVNYAFLELEIGISSPLNIPDELWVSIDTYEESLGETLLPNGITAPSGAEFALKITNYSAELYVTQAYDIYGIWHGIEEPYQLFQSISTHGSPWEIVRIKNNYSHSDVQYIGNMKVNYDFQLPSSMDGVIISESNIKIKLPWSYINVVAPNKMRILHDDKNTYGREDSISDGFNFAVNYKNQWFEHENRVKWETWDRIYPDEITPTYKKSFYVMKDRLPEFNTKAVAYKDSFYFEGPFFPTLIEKKRGLLSNDFDLDGNSMTALIVENPLNGEMSLETDGSFSYMPNSGFIGLDSMKYCIFDGYSLSSPNSVIMYVEQNNTKPDTTQHICNIQLSPNPCSGSLIIESEFNIELLQIFDVAGKKVFEKEIDSWYYSFNSQKLPKGVYVAVAKIEGKLYAEKFVKN